MSKQSQPETSDNKESNIQNDSIKLNDSSHFANSPRLHEEATGHLSSRPATQYTESLPKDSAQQIRQDDGSVKLFITINENVVLNSEKQDIPKALNLGSIKEQTSTERPKQGNDKQLP